MMMVPVPCSMYEASNKSMGIKRINNFAKDGVADTV